MFALPVALAGEGASEINNEVNGDDDVLCVLVAVNDGAVLALRDAIPEADEEGDEKGEEEDVEKNEEAGGGDDD